jgi:hypothetical protein
MIYSRYKLSTTNEKKQKSSSIESPIMRPINKFDVFNNIKSKGSSVFQQGYFFNDKKTPKYTDKKMFSPPKK